MINITEKRDYFGLDYEPLLERVVQDHAKTKVQSFQEVFHSVAFVHDNQVGALEANTMDSKTPFLVYHFSIALDNRESIDLP